MVGCSQSPQGKEQKVSQPVLQPVESAPLGGSQKQAIPEEQGGEGIFAIQVASFHDLSRAESLVEELKKESYRAYVSPEDLEKQGRWYRVRVGNFKTKEEAESQLPKLKEKFVDCFIRRR